MSQVATRKTAASEDKDKGTDSSAKDTKKKMAANTEKEKADKQTDKTDKADKNDKPDKHDRSADKTKSNEKVDNKNEKGDKTKHADKSADKDKDKPSGSDKNADKKAEKNGVDHKKTDGKEKKDSHDKKDDKVDKNAKTKNGTGPKQNGAKQNGQSNGVEEASDDDVLEIADDEFPELTYDDRSDAESPPLDAPSRSHTRRSQVKAARTPETPQPATEKSADPAPSHDSKDQKSTKTNEVPSERKLRSADSPKPDSKKETEGDKKEKGDEKSPKKSGDKEKASPKQKENGDNDLEIIELDDDEPRKPDTNYSKSRVKVSPYRRSMRLADQTTSSVMANYTGNNTTMEMDITESSIAEDESLNDSSYLQGLRTIKGRKSYKPLKDIAIKHVTRSVKSTTSVTVPETAGSRPTAPVVGRKRKPEGDETIEIATEAGELTSAVHSKRMRLLDRIAFPFRRTIASTPLPARRNAEIVGINTDLPLTAPVASPSFDPETLKPEPTRPAPELPAISVTPATPAPIDKDGKRCVVM